MKLFAFKKIPNSTLFEDKIAIIWACPPFGGRSPAGRAFHFNLFFGQKPQKSISISIANAKPFTIFDLRFTIF
ncbi:MAG TPA: hypothetical protein VIO43_12380 [Lutibacter sp.]